MDTLSGGQGNDTYTLSRGDGADVAIDSYHYTELDLAGSIGAPGSGGGASHDVHANSGTDTLAFGAGIRITDVDMQFVGSDLYVGLRQPGVPASQDADRIKLTNWGAARPRRRRPLDEAGASELEQVASKPKPPRKNARRSRRRLAPRRAGKCQHGLHL